MTEKEKKLNNTLKRTHCDILLIGMPFVGKTTLGRILADRLGVEFVDIDGIVEQNCRRQIWEIVESQGIDAFRQEESQAVKSLLTINCGRVIACGGGSVTLPCFDSFCTNRRVVYLYASLSTLLQRKNDSKTVRPLVSENALRDLENLYEQRKDLYCNFAHLTLDTSDKMPTQCVDQLVEMLS